VPERKTVTALELGSNSVTSAALFAGYGQKFGMPAAPTCWPRRGGPRGRIFFGGCYSRTINHTALSRLGHGRLDIMMMSKRHTG